VLKLFICQHYVSCDPSAGLCQLNGTQVARPVGRIPGVGKVTEEKLKQLEVQTIADLRAMDLPTREGRFGCYGAHLYELARGIDESDVRSSCPSSSNERSGGILW